VLLASDPDLSWAVSKAIMIVASAFVSVMGLAWIAFKRASLR